MKNYHREPFESKFSFTKRYFQSLIKYSELVNCPIKFAIYYSKTNLWVLLEPSDFTENKSRYVIDLPSAMMRNEMVALGDEWISTKPPLEICIVSDSSKPATYDDATGQSNFTIKNVFAIVLVIW